MYRELIGELKEEKLEGELGYDVTVKKVNYDDTELREYITKIQEEQVIQNANIDNKVDKIKGKELSSNDFTNEYKEKLNGLENYDDTNIKEDILNIKEEQRLQEDNIENNKETIEDIQKNIETIQDEQNIQNNDIENTRKEISEIQQNIIRIQEQQIEQETKIDNKVDSVNGKGLSTNDFTDTDKLKLEELHNYDDTSLKNEIKDNTENILEIKKELEDKVDKVEGKDLSSNDFTDKYKEKLDNLTEIGGYDDTSLKNELEKLKEENSLLKSQIPSGEIEGEYIHLKDSSNMPFNKFKISGNSFQETREGYNLAKINETDWELTDNNTIKNKAGNSGKLLTEFKLKKGQTIKINLKIITKLPDLAIAMYIDNVAQSSEMSFNSAYENELNVVYTKTYTAIEDCTVSYKTWGNTNSAIFEFQFWVVEGTIEKPYEPYGAMPSIDYPSEVRNCGEPINLFNKDGDITDNYHYNTDTGEIERFGGDFIQNDYILVKPNTWYCLYASDRSWLRHIEYDENKNFIKGSTENNFQTTSETRYVRLSTGMLKKDSLIFKEGICTTNYKEYGKKEIEIVKSNKNILDFRKEDWLGCYFNDNETENFYYGLDAALMDKKIYYCKGNITLSFKTLQDCEISRGQIAWYDRNKQPIGKPTSVFWGNKYNANEKVVKTYSVPENASYFRINFRNVKKKVGTEYQDINMQEEFYDYIGELMIEEGSIATKYEAHEGVEFTIPVQKTFKAIRNTRDTFIKKDEKWYEQHWIKRYTFTGDEGWEIFNDIFYLYSITDYSRINNIPLCNYFKGINNVLNYAGLKENNTICFNNPESPNDRLFVRCDKFKTIVEFKAFLKEKYNTGTPVYVDYVLKEPELVECTEEQIKVLEEIQNSKNYKNETIVYSTNQVLPKVEINYSKDLETLFNNLTVAIISQGGI